MTDILDKPVLAWGEQFKPDFTVLRLNYGLYPSKEYFPSSLNPKGRPQWDSLFDENDPYRGAEQLIRKDEAWHSYVLEYTKRARKANIPPFSYQSVNLNNDLLVMELMSQRRHLVRFANKYGFFNKFYIKKIHRHYDFNQDDMVIEVKADLWPNSLDPTLEDWVRSIQGPRMLRSPESSRLYKKELPQGPILWVRFIHSQRIQLGYTITVDKLPVIVGLTRVPTKAIMTRFMEQNIWLPIVRTYRFQGAKFRLF